jgi:hypothetical protein
VTKQFAERLLSDKSSGRLDLDLIWAFRHLLEAANNRAQREARAKGESFSLGVPPRLVLYVLIESYGIGVVRSWLNDLEWEADETVAPIVR